MQKAYDEDTQYMDKSYSSCDMNICMFQERISMVNQNEKCPRTGFTVALGQCRLQQNLQVEGEVCSHFGVPRQSSLDGRQKRRFDLD